MKTAILTILLDPATKTAFHAAAEKHGLSLSAAARLLVEGFVDGNIKISAFQKSDNPLNFGPILQKTQKSVAQNLNSPSS